MANTWSNGYNTFKCKMVNQVCITGLTRCTSILNLSFRSTVVLIKSNVLELPPWYSGLGLQLQWFGSLQRCRFDPWPGVVRKRIQHCSSYSVCRSCSSDSVPAQELANAKEPQKKKKGKRKKKYIWSITWFYVRAAKRSHKKTSYKTYFGQEHSLSPLEGTHHKVNL